MITAPVSSYASSPKQAYKKLPSTPLFATARVLPLSDTIKHPDSTFQTTHVQPSRLLRRSITLITTTSLS